jgi:hypothetical protein
LIIARPAGLERQAHAFGLNLDQGSRDRNSSAAGPVTATAHLD